MAATNKPPSPWRIFERPRHGNLASVHEGVAGTCHAISVRCGYAIARLQEITRNSTPAPEAARERRRRGADDEERHSARRGTDHFAFTPSARKRRDVFCAITQEKAAALVRAMLRRS